MLECDDKIKQYLSKYQIQEFYLNRYLFLLYAEKITLNKKLSNQLLLNQILPDENILVQMMYV